MVAIPFEQGILVYGVAEGVMHVQNGRLVRPSAVMMWLGTRRVYDR